MPLEIQCADQPDLCRGHIWAVRDEKLLARMVGALLLGEHVHGADLRSRLLTGPPLQARTPTIDRVIDWLTVPPGEQWNWKRWHRDGLVFQLISWIAAHMVAQPGTLVRMPHPLPADKGLDGLLLEPPENGRPFWVAVVCEDKATETPRRVVRDEVWPDFAGFVNGERDNEVRADAGALVERLPSKEEKERVLQDILWRQELRFRVCVAVDADCDCEPELNVLFAGYNGVVPGPDITRRRGETLHIDEGLRAWMDRFSTMVIAELRQVRTGSAPPLKDEAIGLLAQTDSAEAVSDPLPEPVGDLSAPAPENELGGTASV